MKRWIVACFCVLITSVCVWAKVDFSKPAPVKEFEPLAPTGTAAVPKFKKTSNTNTVPVNVIPIFMDTYEVKNGRPGYNHGICSAMRLTSELVLTAAHCLEGFSHGQRIYAEPFTTTDNRWGLTFVDIKTQEEFVKPNAKVVFYRPGYSPDGSVMSHAFDFAVIKLDTKLKLNANAVDKEMQKVFSKLPRTWDTQQWEERAKQIASEEVKKEFNKQQTIYKQFMDVSLQKFDLLQMAPDVVQEEMKNRTVHAYFWPLDEKTDARGPVQVFSGSILGTDKRNHGNTHTLLWNIRTVPGTSGSPVLDVQRKLVVSVTSGPIHGESEHGGGLISAEVCRWVKSQDSSVKCLAVYGGATYAETSGTAKWGR